MSRGIPVLDRSAIKVSAGSRTVATMKIENARS